jgi:hypothetical protein
MKMQMHSDLEVVRIALQNQLLIIHCIYLKMYANDANDANDDANELLK